MAAQTIGGYPLVRRHLPENCYGQRSFDERQRITPEGIVIHYISDRWGHYGSDPYSIDSIVQLLSERGLSYHHLIGRDGTIYELVPPPLRAFHAGTSEWKGRADCNDWTLAATPVGMHGEPFEDAQYDALAALTGRLVQDWPIRQDCIPGHEHIAPDRKRDPGPTFDWDRYETAIAGFWRPQ